ncbi:MAG: nitroreductase family protein [Fibrobacter sp.]|uniref:nitroreductase family protein n=1 Tax=Fibrobacter sp. TaxID=35828 RepID=UPI00388D204E|nr:nitroreductase family protein [Fibrobacter sp.]
MQKIYRMVLAVLIFPFIVLAAPADSDSVIKFGAHLQRNGRDVMQAFANRKSGSNFSMKIISNEDLGNLLWAANGINRPETGHRTAPSALNKQDVSLYVFTQKNVYLYDPQAHAMNLVVKGDHRSLFTERMKTPVIVLLVSDVSKFDSVPGSLEDHKMTGALDAGIVSENISIFCASMGISTRVRASMDKTGLQKLLNLSELQLPLLNHAVGYEK